MDTIESLIQRGYRVYKLKGIPSRSMREYLKGRKGIQVDYHEVLKVITVRDANKSRV